MRQAGCPEGSLKAMAWPKFNEDPDDVCAHRHMEANHPIVGEDELVAKLATTLLKEDGAWEEKFGQSRPHPPKVC